jgi:hypothetical protein
MEPIGEELLGRRGMFKSGPQKALETALLLSRGMVSLGDFRGGLSRPPGATEGISGGNSAASFLRFGCNL